MLAMAAEHPAFDMASPTASFPAVRSVLWTRTPTGPPQSLTCGPVSLVLHNNALRLLHTHLVLRSKRPSSPTGTQAFLIGSMAPGALIVRADRFDPGSTLHLPGPASGASELCPTVTVPGDYPIPVTFNANPPLVSTPEWTRLCDDIHAACALGAPVSLPSLLGVRLSVVGIGGAGDSSGAAAAPWLQLAINATHPAARLKCTPVPYVSVLRGPLARKLSQITALPADLPVEVESGYLTMDSARHAVLLAEDDPVVPQTPIIGIWVSGARCLDDPAVWAACLRFMYTDRIRDRALLAPAAFLVALYSHGKRDPDFFECCDTLAGSAPPFTHLSLTTRLELPEDQQGNTVTLTLPEAVHGPDHQAFLATFSLSNNTPLPEETIELESKRDQGQEEGHGRGRTERESSLQSQQTQKITMVRKVAIAASSGTSQTLPSARASTAAAAAAAAAAAVSEEEPRSAPVPSPLSKVPSGSMRHFTSDQLNISMVDAAPADSRFGVESGSSDAPRTSGRAVYAAGRYEDPEVRAGAQETRLQRRPEAEPAPAQSSTHPFPAPPYPLPPSLAFQFPFSHQAAWAPSFSPPAPAYPDVSGNVWAYPPWLMQGAAPQQLQQLQQQQQQSPQQQDEISELKLQIQKLQEQLARVVSPGSIMNGSRSSSTVEHQDAAINTSVLAFSREGSLVKPEVFVTDNSPVASPVKMDNSPAAGSAGPKGGREQRYPLLDEGTEPSLSALHRNSFKLEAEHSSFHSDTHVDIPSYAGSEESEDEEGEGMGSDQDLNLSEHIDFLQKKLETMLTPPRVRHASRDSSIAAELSTSPSQWDLALDESLKDGRICPLTNLASPQRPLPHALIDASPSISPMARRTRTTSSPLAKSSQTADQSYKSRKVLPPALEIVEDPDTASKLARSDTEVVIPTPTLPDKSPVFRFDADLLQQPPSPAASPANIVIEKRGKWQTVNVQDADPNGKRSKVVPVTTRPQQLSADEQAGIAAAPGVPDAGLLDAREGIFQFPSMQYTSFLEQPTPQSLQADQIARKYLPKKSPLEDSTNMNGSSPLVNMSMHTMQYMKRHNLLDDIDDQAASLAGPVSASQAAASGSSTKVIDTNRLRTLPKLL